MQFYLNNIIAILSYNELYNPNYEGSTPMTSDSPHESPLRREDGGRVPGAGGEALAQLVAVVGEVAHLQEPGHKEERQQYCSRAQQANLRVQLHPRGFCRGMYFIKSKFYSLNKKKCTV